MDDMNCEQYEHEQYKRCAVCSMSSLDTRTLLKHDHSWNTSHLGTACDKTVGVDEQTIYNMNILELLVIWTHGQ